MAAFAAAVSAPAAEAAEAAAEDVGDAAGGVGDAAEDVQAASDTTAAAETPATTTFQAVPRFECLGVFRVPVCGREAGPGKAGSSETPRVTLPHCRSPLFASTTTLLLIEERTMGCYERNLLLSDGAVRPL